jgi:hypothetical protein
MRWIGSLASGMVLLAAINSPARAAIECRAELPQSRTGHWSWRQIEGRKCWFPGRAGVDKAQLRWPTAAAAPAPASQPETVTIGRSQRREGDAAADEGVARAPRQPSPSPAKELTFEQRWAQ